MKDSADVVIIGGGVVGCSILYNLGRLGITDTLLLERDVLNSGSTGRTAAICRMPLLQSGNSFNGLGKPPHIRQLRRNWLAARQDSSRRVTW